MAKKALIAMRGTEASVRTFRATLPKHRRETASAVTRDHNKIAFPIIAELHDAVSGIRAID